VTVSDLILLPQPIVAAQQPVAEADVVVCLHEDLLAHYDVVTKLGAGGTFLLLARWAPDEVDTKLPGRVKQQLAQRDAVLHVINPEVFAGETTVCSCIKKQNTNANQCLSKSAVHLGEPCEGSGVVAPATSRVSLADVLHHTSWMRIRAHSCLSDRQLACSQPGAGLVLSMIQLTDHLPETTESLLAAMRQGLLAGKDMNTPDLSKLPKVQK
jgi:hypothetical protein